MVMKTNAAHLKAMSRAIDEILRDTEGRQTGFCLFVFPFGDDPDNRFLYASNTEREDMLKALKEFIKNHEHSTHDVPVTVN